MGIPFRVTAGPGELPLPGMGERGRGDLPDCLSSIAGLPVGPTQESEEDDVRQDESDDAILLREIYHYEGAEYESDLQVQLRKDERSPGQRMINV